MLVTDRLLKRLYQCGAFPAEPGEFTKRAFLNGRMDLTQAEAVMDVISAGSDVLRMVPPLVITKDDIDEMIEKLEKALQ